MPTEDLDRLEALVRARRTHLLIDPDLPVPADLVERLCALVTWAPNHKRTWPWVAAVFTGTGRDRLGEAGAQDMEVSGIGDPGRWAKTRTKYRRAPVVVTLGSAADPHPTFHEENRDAVAAGIQNLLLGATAAGLASFWSTPAVAEGPATLALCGFAPGARVIGVIYLGWPTGTVPVPERPALPLTRVES